MARLPVFLAAVTLSLSACNSFPFCEDEQSDDESTIQSNDLITAWEKKRKEEQKEKESLAIANKKRVNHLSDIVIAGKFDESISYHREEFSFDNYKFTRYQISFFKDEIRYTITSELPVGSLLKYDKRPLIQVYRSIDKGLTDPDEKVWISFYDYHLDGIFDVARWDAQNTKGIPYFYLESGTKKLQSEVQVAGHAIIDELIEFLEKK